MNRSKFHKIWYLNNKEKIRKYNEKYYLEHKEEQKKRMKNYYQNHKESYLERYKQYYSDEKNRERKRIRLKKYYSKNRDKILESRHTPKFREVQRRYHHSLKGKIAAYRKYSKNNKNLPINFTLKDYQYILKRDKNCVYCGSDKGLTLDHVNPRGSTDLSNLILCCRSCNSSKKSKDVFFFCDLYGLKVPPIVLQLKNNKT